MDTYNVKGLKTERIDINVDGKEIYRIWQNVFKAVTGLESNHRIKDGKLIQDHEYGGHTTYYEEEVIREATPHDIILLQLRNDIKNGLCK